MAKAKAASQLLLPFPKKGGARANAGRKAARYADGKRVHASHEKRKGFAKSRPLHVTIELEEGLPSLRSAWLSPVVCEALERANRREDFRIVHVCLLSNHVHLICEADGKDALTAGVRGVNVTIAKALNKALERTGRVVRERYHVHVLQSPKEVRNAVQYVLRNGERHGVHVAWAKGSSGPRPDPFSSAAWFPYWREKELGLAPGQLGASVVRAARTYLMRAAFEGAPLSFATPLGRGRAEANRGGGVSDCAHAVRAGGDRGPGGARGGARAAAGGGGAGVARSA